MHLIISNTHNKYLRGFIAYVTLRHKVNKSRVPVVLSAPFPLKTGTKCSHYCLSAEFDMVVVLPSKNIFTKNSTAAVRNNPHVLKNVQVARRKDVGIYISFNQEVS